MELSNLNTALFKVVGLIIFSIAVLLTFVTDYYVYSFTNNFIGGFPFPFGFISLFGSIIFYYLLFGQYHKVLFDDNKLYYSGLFSKKEIQLEDISKLSIGYFPIRNFFYITYRITIKLNNGKKIRCMSSEISLSDQKENIKEYKILKDKIEKNNNR